MRGIPLGDRVVVEQFKTQEEVTKAGIIIPEVTQERPDSGIVLAVGQGTLLEDGRRVPMETKVGDTVIFGKYAGSTIEVDDKELLIMRECDILMVFPKPDENPTKPAKESE